MHVGIITLHRTKKNSGAVLQAYALQSVIQDMNHTVEVIDYYPYSLAKADRLFHFEIKPSTIARNIYALSRRKTIKRLTSRFEDFLGTYLNLTDRQYKISHHLYKEPPIFDAYICGSDQVWNPLRDFEDGGPYFLDFVPMGRRRIAYAPSFGVTEIPASRREFIAHNVEKIDFISVRETQGQQIIKEITGREATLTLDPTLLIPARAWATIAKPVDIQGPYILIYGVSSAFFAGLISKVKHETKLKTVAIYPGLRRSPFPSADYILRDIGPAEFLWLFQNATGTIINTFHGAAFSVINRKPFLATLGDNPSRLISLLNILGLSQHLVTEKTTISSGGFTACMRMGISNIESNLQLYQQESLAFLAQALAP